MKLDKNIRTIFTVVVIAIAIAILFFYTENLNGTISNSTNGNLTIVVSFNPIYYLVKPVVGNSVNIQQIIAPGAEPHGYGPTPQDALNLSKGSVFFYDGPSLENWAVSLVQATNKNIVEVPLIDAINTSQLNNDTSITVADPHFWLDPAIMPAVVIQIKNTMMAADPVHATQYAANANSFIAGLNQLNLAYESGLANCKSRVVIDSHAFLGYMAISYNLTELPVGGDNPDIQPSAQHLANVISNATADGAHAIFQESADPTSAVDQNIAQSINGSIYKIYTIEILSPQQIAGGQNYTSLMYQNLHTLEAGLNCTGK
ncbi:MAG TPA: metal ABC transporter substrate-binding protein [Candidatus Aquilonibacter sp.]|nr:metal ABC transporter substrate-binding protein [Candidatus Aquilonibacter sp.]